jgi:hypothetical protein
MEKLISDFLIQKRFVVAGSFRNESKYAYKILRILKNKGYEVYPVHPTIKEIEGQLCYPSVKDIPCAVDVVNLVTPPLVTERILVECKDKGIRRIWIQPGAESQAAIKFCGDNDMKVIHGICVILESAKEKEVL